MSSKKNNHNQKIYKSWESWQIFLLEQTGETTPLPSLQEELGIPKYEILLKARELGIHLNIDEPDATEHALSSWRLSYLRKQQVWNEILKETTKSLPNFHAETAMCNSEPSM